MRAICPESRRAPRAAGQRPTAPSGGRFCDDSDPKPGRMWWNDKVPSINGRTRPPAVGRRPALSLATVTLMAANGSTR